MTSSLTACAFVTATCVVAGVPGISTAAPPTRAEAVAALRKAADFFHTHCAKHGGYVWRYSRDLKLSEGEAETGPDTIWVQPPGTPAVGLAFLDAYEATSDRFYLDAAKDAADALVKGQMQSGGWHYAVHFDPAERAKWGYRDNAAYRPARRGRDTQNLTVIDDDTTPAAVRFLARIDRALEFKERAIHEAALFALDSLLVAQYPNGGWSHNYDRYPQPHSTDEFPVLQARFPETWSRKWLNDWPGRYYTNDNIAGNMLATMLDAWEVYGDDRYLASANRTGEFFLRAQLPDPQPAWAQQYDRSMQPCWDRKFEPPAISGLESQYVLDALLRLYRKTGEERFLAPVPRAIAYLKKSRLPNGRLARFYELETNRPLYFTKDYELTYNADDSPTHYGFEFDSRLDEFAAGHRRLLEDGPREKPKPADREKLAAEAQAIIDGMDDRGAWVDARGMKGFRKASLEGVIQSETFVRNVGTLVRYLQSTAAQ